MSILSKHRYACNAPLQPFSRLSAFRLAFSNAPAPASQDLDDFRGDRRGQRDADKDEALVDGISKSQLSPYTWK